MPLTNAETTELIDAKARITINWASFVNWDEMASRTTESVAQ